MHNPFKEGDRVRCIHTGQYLWLRLKEYIVAETGSFVDQEPWIILEAPELAKKKSARYPVSLFELARMSNEERIRKRMEELKK